MTTDIYALKCNGGGKKMGKQTVTNCITTILSYAEFVQQDYYCRDEDSLNYVFILEMISDDFDFFQGTSHHELYKQCFNINTGDDEFTRKVAIDLLCLEYKTQDKINELKCSVNTVLQKTEIFYGCATQNMIIEYSNALFEYIEVIKNGTGVREIRDASRLLKVIAEIRQSDAFSKIIL